MTTEILFSANHAENVAGGLFPDLFLFFELYELRASGWQLSFNIF